MPSLSFSRWRWMRLRSPSGVKRGIRKHETPPSACARTRNASHIGAEKNHLWPVISYSAPGPPPFERPRGGRVGAHVRAALLLGHPHPAQRALLVDRRDQALAVVFQRAEARLPLLAPARAASAAPGSPSRSSRSGTSPRPRPGPGASRRRRARRARRAGARATARRGCRARRRSPSARARRDGTRPRRRGCRSGRACAAAAGSRWPVGPARSRRRARRPPPARRSRSSAHSAPSRATASVRTASASKTL